MNELNCDKCGAEINFIETRKHGHPFTCCKCNNEPMKKAASELDRITQDIKPGTYVRR